MTVSIVNYGLGNLGSVVNMLKRAGTQSKFISTPDEVLGSERVLLPGIGAFDEGMSRLENLDLISPLRDFADSGRPLFGICLGMQLLLGGSEEGNLPGLGLVSGRSARFSNDLHVPHMGWNIVTPTRSDPLVADLPPESRFYFVHSYRVVLDQKQDELAYSDYGGSFTSMLRSGNVMGAQFHPEKSHAFGLTVLKNFATA